MTDPAAEPPASDLLDRVAGDLADVERALARLDDGTYATCEVCAGPIDAERLRAAPTTRTCGAHDTAAG